MSLLEIRDKVSQYEREYDRTPNSVQIIAVSKHVDVSKIKTLYDMGQRQFAENVVQEAITKIARLSSCEMVWHYIGDVQTNKTKKIAENFSWVHSISKTSVAKRIALQRPANLPPMNCLIQVNVDADPAKHGVDIDNVFALADSLLSYPQLKLRGLMTVPKKSIDFEKQLSSFLLLKRLFDKMKSSGYVVDTLSMGMSDDYRAAIAAGANMIRLGRALFGDRI